MQRLLEEHPTRRPRFTVHLYLEEAYDLPDLRLEIQSKNGNLSLIEGYQGEENTPLELCA